MDVLLYSCTGATERRAVNVSRRRKVTKYGVQIESYGEIDFTCIGAGTMNLTGDIYVNGKELKV